MRFRLTKVRFTLYFVWTRKIAEGASFFSTSQHEDSRPILLAAPMPTGEMGRKRRYIYAIICCCASSLWIYNLCFRGAIWYQIWRIYRAEIFLRGGGAVKKRLCRKVSHPAGHRHSFNAFVKLNHYTIIGGFAVAHAVLGRNLLDMVIMVCRKGWWKWSG